MHTFNFLSLQGKCLWIFCPFRNRSNLLQLRQFIPQLFCCLGFCLLLVHFFSLSICVCLCVCMWYMYVCVTGVWTWAFTTFRQVLCVSNLLLVLSCSAVLNPSGGFLHLQPLQSSFSPCLNFILSILISTKLYFKS
jgi:hypothetical protein